MCAGIIRSCLRERIARGCWGWIHLGTRMRKEYTSAIGKRIKWMALVSLSGRLAVCTSVSGPPTIKMASAFCLSKVETNMQESSCRTKDRAMGITNGPTIANSRAGGTRISSMGLGCILARKARQRSLGYGRWASGSSGLAILSVKVLGMANWIILHFYRYNTCIRLTPTKISPNRHSSQNTDK